MREGDTSEISVILGNSTFHKLMCQSSSVSLSEVLVRPTGDKKLKSRHNHLISKFSECLSRCVFESVFRLWFGSIFPDCSGEPTWLWSIQYKLYLVNLVKPGKVGWVMEENAITVFVPVQDCSRTVFAETSDLQSNVIISAAWEFLQMRLFIFLLWRSVGSGHLDRAEQWGKQGGCLLSSGRLSKLSGQNQRALHGTCVISAELGWEAVQI